MMPRVTLVMQSYTHANSSTLSRPPPYWLLYLRKTSQKPSYSIQGYKDLLRLKINLLLQEVAPGSHATDAAVNKQQGNKERIAAALEISYLKKNMSPVVDLCCVFFFQLHSLFNHNLYYMIRVWTEELPEFFSDVPKSNRGEEVDGEPHVLRMSSWKRIFRKIREEDVVSSSVRLTFASTRHGRASVAST
ncbi:hypothetical protein DY000_02051077 [Brassica cretica]|uniref:Uncharacterized protein n=1 Tax=Brassica cretica TaxID=69181 RepID=A0ABQ7F220_BRACR|nr:hypothetical protein DY000_02051077 [Brassica cretica]